MSVLAGRIGEIVRHTGPITLERYWTIALFDREHGYYSSRDPFGMAGDFTTAPEISQMFGELVGAWMVTAWHALGSPAPFTLAEMGPGRGTMMADILRTVARLDPAFLKAARVHLVETSERLSRLQSERLSIHDLPIRHVRRLEDLEGLPLLLVSNELFDAIAIRQFQFSDKAWRERLIGLDAKGALAFVPSDPVPTSGLPLGGLPLGGLPPPEEGDILELSPARQAIAATMARLIADRGGVALAIDYGHARRGYGDTLQAVRAHAFADPLDGPGEADITSHVDFASLADAFGRSGLATGITDQSSFLLALGLLERAGALGAGRGTGHQEAIHAAAQRLAGRGPNEMGSLFKVLAAAPAALPLPPFAPAPTEGSHP